MVAILGMEVVHSFDEPNDAGVEANSDKSDANDRDGKDDDGAAADRDAAAGDDAPKGNAPGAQNPKAVIKQIRCHRLIGLLPGPFALITA